MDSNRTENNAEFESPLVWGIAKLPLIPLRNEPSERSEMVTQVLYGERLVTLEQQQDWSKVRLNDDGYVGWCATKMITPVSREEWEAVSAYSLRVVTKPASHCLTEKGVVILPAGSRLFPDDVPVDEMVGEDLSRLDASSVAKRFLNAPYLWGGKSIFGIDCSGLVQVVHLLIGYQLPRDASQQALLGESVGSLKEAHPGDLAFFSNPEGKIVHVGLVMENGFVIHASGSVRIDVLDENGIVNQETKSYSHRLVLLKRISF